MPTLRNVNKHLLLPLPRPSGSGDQRAQPRGDGVHGVFHALDGRRAARRGAARAWREGRGR
eukprot:3702157-Pyramimonas_sp.AAC.1